MSSEERRGWWGQGISVGIPDRFGWDRGEFEVEVLWVAWSSLLQGYAL